jgi:protein involved in polysaccharide export with SLBB domain
MMKIRFALTGLLTAGLFASGHSLPGDIGGSLDNMQDLRSALGGDLPDDSYTNPTAPTPFETPLDEKAYRVGPGDELQIFVGKSYYLQVSPESDVLFPGLEPIPVKGATLAEAKVIIKEALGRHFKKNLIYVNIRQVKIIKVAVLGEVNKPGLYTVPCNTRLSELVSKAEGFAKLAKVPRVKVLRDSSEQEYDLGEYYRTGKTEQNPYLNQGERLMVPRFDPTQPNIELNIGLSSYFYQLVTPKTLAEIITEMSGAAKAADLRAVRLNSGRLLYGDEMLTYQPRSGDVIELLGSGLRIFVEGEVGHPYIYAYVPGNTVRDYAAEAGLSITSQSDGGVEVVRSTGKVETLDLASSQLFPGDHIHVRRTRYALFKDYLVTLGALATVVLTTAYLIQISKSL